jgi:hypothetical protein
MRATLRALKQCRNFHAAGPWADTGQQGLDHEVCNAEVIVQSYDAQRRKHEIRLFKDLQYISYR